MKKALLIVLLVLLIGIMGVELFFLVTSRTQDAPETVLTPVMTQSPEVTSPPPPTMPPATAEPASTPVPTVEPAVVTPEPTAVPVVATPEPTPVPTPAPSDGSFQSNTGTNLNLVVSWRTEDLGIGNTRVYVNGTVTSYSLQVMATSVSISFGSYSASATGSAIMLEDGVSKTETSLFSTSLDVPKGTSGTMTVDWAYRGTYSGVSLPNIQASGEVSA